MQMRSTDEEQMNPAVCRSWFNSLAERQPVREREEKESVIHRAIIHARTPPATSDACESGRESLMNQLERCWCSPMSSARGMKWALADMRQIWFAVSFPFFPARFVEEKKKECSSSRFIYLHSSGEENPVELIGKLTSSSRTSGRFMSSWRFQLMRKEQSSPED